MTALPGRREALSCAWAAITGALLFVNVPAGAATGGPDAHGYVWIDSNEPGGPVFDWEPGTTPLGVPTGGAVSASLPFPFEFYGQVYNSIDVGDDGVLTFSGAYPGSISTCLPALSDPGIVPWWDHWDSAVGEVARRVHGPAQDRQVVFSYTDVQHSVTEGLASFEVKLFEDDHAIEFHYLLTDVGGDAACGGTATVGVDGAGAGYLEVSCDAANLADGYAVRFELQAGGDDDDDSSGDDDDSSGDDDDSAGDDDDSAGDDDDSTGDDDDSVGDDDDSTGDDDDSAGDDDDSASDDDDDSAGDDDDDDSAGDDDDDSSGDDDDSSGDDDDSSGDDDSDDDVDDADDDATAPTEDSLSASGCQRDCTGTGVRFGSVVETSPGLALAAALVWVRSRRFFSH